MEYVEWIMERKREEKLMRSQLIRSLKFLK